MTIKAVKVCASNGFCPLDAIIAGMNFVMNEHYTYSSIPKVANMSLGGGADESLDYSVFTAIDAGVSKHHLGNLDGLASRCRRCRALFTRTNRD